MGDFYYVLAAVLVYCAYISGKDAVEKERLIPFFSGMLAAGVAGWLIWLARGI